MVSVLASSAVDRVFEPQSGQTKDYKIGMCCFSALCRKSKDWLARNQNNVYEWSDMSTRELLFQWEKFLTRSLNFGLYCRRLETYNFLGGKLSSNRIFLEPEESKRQRYDFILNNKIHVWYVSWVLYVHE